MPKLVTWMNNQRVGELTFSGDSKGAEIPGSADA